MKRIITPIEEASVRAEQYREPIRYFMEEEKYLRIVQGMREEKHTRYPNWNDANDYDDDLDFYITCCC